MTDDTEWTCADCGHKQRGHRFKCEKCGFYIGHVDTGVWERESIKLDPVAATSIALAMSATKAATIERCAQVADRYKQPLVADEIRALKDS